MSDGEMTEFIHGNYVYVYTCDEAQRCGIGEGVSPLLEWAHHPLVLLLVPKLIQPLLIRVLDVPRWLICFPHGHHYTLPRYSRNFDHNRKT
jgi:hypothetical protein